MASARAAYFARLEDLAAGESALGDFGKLLLRKEGGEDVSEEILAFEPQVDARR